MILGSVGYYRRTEDLARTRAEQARAEANLNLAVMAFEDVFAELSQRSTTGSLGNDEELWTDVAAVPVLAENDVRVLQTLVEFYDRFIERNKADTALRADTAKAYSRVGLIHAQLGRRDDAKRAFDRAIVLYEELAKTAPTPGPYLVEAGRRSQSSLRNAFSRFHRCCIRGRPTGVNLGRQSRWMYRNRTSSERRKGQGPQTTRLSAIGETPPSFAGTDRSESRDDGETPRRSVSNPRRSNRRRPKEPEIPAPVSPDAISTPGEPPDWKDIPRRRPILAVNRSDSCGVWLKMLRKTPNTALFWPRSSSSRAPEDRDRGALFEKKTSLF